MVIFSACSKPVGVFRKNFFLARTRARFLERNRLEITGRYGLAVVPPNLEGAKAHFWQQLRDYVVSDV